MKRFLIIVFFAFLLMESPVVAFAEQDWEYWSKYSFEMNLSKKTGLSLKPEFRFKDDFKEYYYSKTYLGLFYKLNKFTEIKAYYAYKTRKEKTGWKQTDLLYLDPTLKFNLGAFGLDNRFRFEYDIDKDELIYRNRLKIKRSFYKIISPFVQEEIFCSFSSGTLVENRFSVGCSVKILKHIGFSGEYMRNSKKVSSSWNEVNVLVTGLSFAF